MPLLKNVIMISIPILVIVSAGVFFVNTGIITTEKPSFKTDIIDVTLFIDYSNGKIDNYTIKISNATVFSVLIKASEEYDFPVGADYYDEFQSHYIYSINFIDEGIENKFWQYYINGDYGIVGADLQPVKDNDIILWKFEEPKI